MSNVVDRKIRARERANDRRKDRIEKGLCPKHQAHFSRLNRCHSCLTQSSGDSPQAVPFDDNLPSPKVGEKLELCIRCDQCGKLYHKGSYYFGDNPSRRRWVEEHPEGVVEGPAGSLLDYRDLKYTHAGTEVLALCGVCREKGINDWQYRRVSRWGGLCDLHTRQSRRLIRDEHIGEERRGITLCWSKANMQEVTAEYDECGCKILMPRSTAINYRNEPPTSGRCIDHQLASPHKKVVDKHIGKEGRGLWLRFTQEDVQGQVLIEYEVCGCSRYAPRQTALAYLHAFEVQGLRVRGMCAEHVKDPFALLEKRIAEAMNGNGQKNGGAVKKQRGGARNVKWSPERRAQLLTTYKNVLPKVQNIDPSLPEDVRRDATLRGNKPSEVALSYAARLIGVEPTSYLETVLTKAKDEEAESARYSNRL
jgi:hypothetical protein